MAETQTILQEVNHDEKAESYVPDEETRYSPRKRLNEDRQPSRKRAQDNDREGGPGAGGRMEGDWVGARNVYQRPRRTE